MNEPNVLLTKRVIAGTVAALPIIAILAFVVALPNRAKLWPAVPRTFSGENAEKSREQLISIHPSDTGKTSCFVRDHFVYVRDHSTGVTKKLLPGEGCNVSGSGALVAVTGERDEPNKIGHPTTIKVLDFNGQTIKDLDSISTSSKANPQWSPDGTRLAFELAMDSQIHVLVLIISNGEWQDVTRNLSFMEPGGDINRYGVELNSWTPEGKSILCQDSNFIYEVALDGRVLQKFPIATIADKLGVQILGNMRFSYSPDRKRMVFCTSSELKSGRVNLALYILDFEKDKAFRLTPDTIDASEPVWLSSGREIVFHRLQPREDAAALWDLCSISTDTREIRTVLKGVSAASYSTR